MTPPAPMTTAGEKKHSTNSNHMTTTDKFPEFQSIPRLLRDVVITEKLDGTNALVAIDADGNVRAGSRSRWITPEQDNYGFAAWVAANTDELRKLGEGLHYGEWWGSGIQRRYGLEEKRFSLFNTGRWHSPRNRTDGMDISTVCEESACCHVVPVLTIRTMSTEHVQTIMERLKTMGSAAAPGFMKPEGIVVFHTKAGHLYKVTLDKNDGHKSVP